ncbi:hypothetical protein H5410_020750, partial [Solanum commersonii]
MLNGKLNDFNTILNDAEKLGGLPVIITETLDFAHVPNGRIEGDSIFKRLDRVLGNSEFMNMLPDTEVTHLIRQGSDHAPLHVKFNAQNSHIAKPFKLINFWTKHSEFHKLVEESWQNECIGTPIKVLQTKLKRGVSGMELENFWKYIPKNIHAGRCDQ